MNTPAADSELVLLRAGEFVCIQINGRAHFAQAPCIRDFLDNLLAGHPSRIVFDLEHCEYMDSTFLGVLTRMAEEFRKGSAAVRSIELFNPSPRITALLASLGVSALFDQKVVPVSLPAGCQASAITSAPPTKIQLKETSLSAHEELIRVNCENLPRFADLTQSLRDDLARLRAGEPPRLPGIDMAGLVCQAGGVGGDFCDFAPRRGVRAAVLVADVSGKGERAAAVAERCRPLLHEQLVGEYSPSAVLSRVLPALVSVLPDGGFITALCLVIDSARRSFQVARAGHEPLLWFHAGTKSVDRIEPNGIALGIDRAQLLESAFAEEEHELATGDVLLLYTDGITDRLNGTAREFGVAGLEAALKESAHLDAKSITKKILGTVEAFGEGEPQSDDTTLVVIKAG
jgi:anti-anti-sigma factor